jgi:hypothetical protein
LIVESTSLNRMHATNDANKKVRFGR